MNIQEIMLRSSIRITVESKQLRSKIGNLIKDDQGDVPGWVLVVLMTTGLVTGIWTLAAPRIQSILRNSLDSMNNVR